MHPDELDELDKLAKRSGLLPDWRPGPCVDFSPASPDLVQKRDLAANRWIGSTGGSSAPGDLPKFDRPEARAAAHAWHKLGEQGLFMGVDFGDYDRYREGKVMGTRCYVTFSSVWELERYYICWLIRSVAWAEELSRRERAGIVVQKVPIKGQLDKLVAVLRHCLTYDARVPSGNVDTSQWLTLGVGGEITSFSWTEGLIHIDSPWAMYSECQRLLAAAGRAAPDRFGSNTERYSWSAERTAERKRLNRLSHAMTNTITRRLKDYREMFMTERQKDE